MPTATDLVTDLPADFAAFGQPVDTSLKALNPETTLGDIAYRSATANTNTRLGIGTTGQVLTVSGGVPAWTTAAGGGKVLQVVSATTTTQVTIATTSLSDTGITATITPTSATSKILVMIMAAQFSARSSTYNNTEAQILRGATVICDWTSGDKYFTGIEVGNGTSVYLASKNGLSYLDSPATTSATTYKLQCAMVNAGSSGTTYFQSQSEISSIILMEIGA
jgi:hypothetical protein